MDTKIFESETITTEVLGTKVDLKTPATEKLAECAGDIFSRDMDKRQVALRQLLALTAFEHGTDNPIWRHPDELRKVKPLVVMALLPVALQACGMDTSVFQSAAQKSSDSRGSRGEVRTKSSNGRRKR